MGVVLPHARREEWDAKWQQGNPRASNSFSRRAILISNSLMRVWGFPHWMQRHVASGICRKKTRGEEIRLHEQIWCHLCTISCQYCACATYAKEVSDLWVRGGWPVGGIQVRQTQLTGDWLICPKDFATRNTKSTEETHATLADQRHSGRKWWGFKRNLRQELEDRYNISSSKEVINSYSLCL